MYDPKLLARSVQVQFPALLEAKYRARRFMQRRLGRPVDADFRLVKYMRLAKHECILDIGANRGEAIDAFRLYHSTRPIFAFEPNAELARRLSIQFAQDDNVSILPFALGSERAQTELSYPVYNGWAFDALASVNDRNSEYLSGAIMGFDPGKMTIKRSACEVRRLDDFPFAPGFIKIDTEGYEREVIRGGLEMIREHRPIVLMENSDPEHNAIELAALGYLPFGFSTKLLPGLGVRNTFYIPKERPLNSFPS